MSNAIRGTHTGSHIAHLWGTLSPHRHQKADGETNGSRPIPPSIPEPVTPSCGPTGSASVYSQIIACSARCDRVCIRSLVCFKMIDTLSSEQLERLMQEPGLVEIVTFAQRA